MEREEISTCSTYSNQYDPFDSNHMLSLHHWEECISDPKLISMENECIVDCGWGRLIFGQTFSKPEALAKELLKEQPGRRDIALYVRHPQVVLALAPQQLFINPSYMYRLALCSRQHAETPSTSPAQGWSVRRIRSTDCEAVQRIYQRRHMVAPPRSFFSRVRQLEEVIMLVAEEDSTQSILGVVSGVDHLRAFNDPDGGSSLWALAVEPQSHYPGIGEGLVNALAEVFYQRRRNFMDLSVLHDNSQAIALYEKLGFKRVPVYSIKKKNSENERLFLGPDPAAELNSYASIIVQEARRRGLNSEVLDAESGYFRLYTGNRSITCCESLSELTSAIAMSWCDDKRITKRLLAQAGLNVPEQIEAHEESSVADFLKKHQCVVVKPARGEYSEGVRLELNRLEDVLEAVQMAYKHCQHVLVEQMVTGYDLRLIVINYQVVAAALRRPPGIVGNGYHSIRHLIEKQSRRRQMATAGRTSIPIDKETILCLKNQGYNLDDIPVAGTRLWVRKSTALHTGALVEDVTSLLHPVLREVGERAAQALKIPVVGLSLMVKAPDQPEYVCIEADYCPSLIHHEPHPTVERFLDLLFPDKH